MPINALSPLIYPGSIVCSKLTASYRVWHPCNVEKKARSDEEATESKAIVCLEVYTSFPQVLSFKKMLFFTYF
jgi:hypothetical protein